MDEVERLRASEAHARKLLKAVNEFLEIEGLLEWWPVFVHAKEGKRDYREIREREGWVVRREGENRD